MYKRCKTVRTYHCLFHFFFQFAVTTTQFSFFFYQRPNKNFANIYFFLIQILPLRFPKYCDQYLLFFARCTASYRNALTNCSKY